MNLGNWGFIVFKGFKKGISEYGALENPGNG